jgi:hypothetical protein
MAYRLEVDGDAEEAQAHQEFLRAEFPEYEQFWLKSVVPLTHRPAGIHFREDADLPPGATSEDVAISQLHYTVMRQLRRAFHVKAHAGDDEYRLSLVLSFLVALQDVAFELLERSRSRGKYDPWKEGRTRGKTDSGQDAREAWKKANKYPLQWVRDYRNKLLHGRTPPAIGKHLPKPTKLDTYADWRKASTSAALADFEEPGAIAERAWQETIVYLRGSWKAHLL